MKKTLLIISILLLLLACRSPRSIRHITKTKLPEISKEKEVFDNWDIFLKKGEFKFGEGYQRGVKIMQNGKKTDTLHTTTTETYYGEWRENEGVFLIIGKKDKGATNVPVYVFDYSQNPFFAVYKEFHPNGNIKIKGIHCYFGFDLGEWYHFDESGDFIYSENKDKDYCSYKKVFRFCKKHNIPLEWGKVDIYKTEGEWEINYSKCCLHVILLDGKTGKRISYEIYDRIKCRCILSKKTEKKVKHIKI